MSRQKSGSQPAAGGQAKRPRGLPCLSSNNCNETVALSTQQKKTAAALSLNIQSLADQYGIENLGFLTLTFRDHIVCPKEAQRRLKSLRTGVLNPRYGQVVRVFERHESGRIHYHLVVVLSGDIRTGFDFEAVKRHDYSSANALLRGEWSFWRKTAPRYGFGRTELLPIRSTAEGIAFYVGKYIGKSISARDPRDKGVRLAEYTYSARMANTKFMFVSDGSRSWRNKMRTFAAIFTERLGVESPTLDDIRLFLGPRWAYNHREFIASLPETTSDSTQEALTASDGQQHTQPGPGQNPQPVASRSELASPEKPQTAAAVSRSRQGRIAPAQPQTGPSARGLPCSDADSPFNQPLPRPAPE